MKRIQTIPILLSILFSAFSFFVLISCNENKSSAGVQNRYAGKPHADAEEAMLNDNKNNDTQFLIETAALCISEIRLAQMAQQKSSNAAVVRLGSALEQSQSLALQELAVLAASKHIVLPDQEDVMVHQAFEELNTRIANDFDRAFTGTLLRVHSEAIMLFENRIRETTDLDINNWIEKTLPGLRQTLEQAELCEKQFAWIS